MSIASELQQIITNKANIKSAIEAKNPSIAPTDNLSQWPVSIASIPEVKDYVTSFDVIACATTDNVYDIIGDSRYNKQITVTKDGEQEIIDTSEIKGNGFRHCFVLRAIIDNHTSDDLLDSDVYVDWGDGNIEKVSDKYRQYKIQPNGSCVSYLSESWDGEDEVCVLFNHTYGQAGKYTVKICGTKFFGILNGMCFNGINVIEDVSLMCDVYGEKHSISKNHTNHASFCRNAVLLTEVHMSKQDLSFVKNIANLFIYCSNLLFASGFNAKFDHVHACSRIFHTCTKLIATDFKLPQPSVDKQVYKTIFYKCYYLGCEFSDNYTTKQTKLEDLLPSHGFFGTYTLQFEDVFSGCSSLTCDNINNVAKMLWNNPILKFQEPTDAFSDCVSLPLNEIPLSWGGYKDAHEQIVISEKISDSNENVYVKVDKKIFNPINDWNSTNITNSTCRDIIYNNNEFICVFDDGIYTSSDGKIFTKSCDLTTDAGYASKINYINNHYFICYTGKKLLYISNDTSYTSWKSLTFPKTNCYNVIYDGSKYIFATSAGIFYTEADLLTATKITLQSTNIIVNVNNLYYNNGLYLATTKADGIKRSVDGIQWTDTNISDIKCTNICYFNNMLFACGSSVYYSLDNGLTWNLTTVNRANLYGFHFTDDLLMCYGQSGIYYSSDGLNWSRSVLIRTYNVITSNNINIAVAAVNTHLDYSESKKTVLVEKELAQKDYVDSLIGNVNNILENI